MPTHKPKLAKEYACPNARTVKYAAKMKDRMTEDKNGQLVTGGIFYCRDSAGFSVSASNKLSCNLTGQCFEIGNKNIPPIRWQQAEEKKRQQHNDNEIFAA